MKREIEFPAAASGIPGGQIIDATNNDHGVSGVHQKSTSEEMRRVLVVDDDENVCAVVQGALSLESIPALCFSNCDETLVFFKRNISSVPLIIADECMPGMSGLELVPIVHSIAPATKMILMSGYYSDDLHPPFIDGSFATFLEKPFGVRTLLDAVERVISFSELRQNYRAQESKH